MADTAWLASFATRRVVDEPDLAGLELDRLGADALLAARIVWQRRVVNEARSVDLARELLAVAPDGVNAALERLLADESRHVGLAARVLRRLGGQEPEHLQSAPPDEPWAWFRRVLTGLVLSETISAARFAVVREHTDLPTFRACIDGFFRDELTHAELGFVLLPDAMQGVPAEVRFDELAGAFGHLDRVIGLGLEERGGAPPPRPQPSDNPGVVEPSLDAFVFYRAVHDELIPRLARLGLPVEHAWAERSR